MTRLSRGWWLLIGVCYCVICPSAATAQMAPALRPLDFNPADLSADGSVVVGAGSGGPVRWTLPAGSQSLGLRPGYDDTLAFAVSADGDTVVGWAGNRAPPWVPTEGEPFRWTTTAGMGGLGPVKDTSMSWGARAASVDGSVAVGAARWAGGAFRWTETSGMAAIPDMHHAAAVSDDGSTVVGLWSAFPGNAAKSAAFTEAVRWTPDDGSVRMGTLPGHTSSYASDVSSDAAVVVGLSTNSSHDDYRAFRWTAAGGMEDLGFIGRDPGGLSARTSADGSVVVCDTILEPFIWDRDEGMRPLRDVLAAVGVDVAGWDLDHVAGISADGRTFIGYGLDPSGNESGWIVTVPEPAGLLLVVLLAPALLHRHGRRRLTHSKMH